MKRIVCAICFLTMLMLLFSGCGGKQGPVKDNSETSSQESSEAEKQYTALDLCRELEGTWTSDEGYFIDFSFKDGKPYMFFAIWESGGAFPTAEMTNLREVGADKYQLTLNFLAIEASEMNDAVAAYSDEYVVENCKDGTIKVNRVGDSQEVYAFDASRQYPLQPDTGPDSYTALDLCWDLEGTWTCDKGNFIDFSFKDGDPYMFFAIWESGGAFPTAEMTNLREVGADKYQLTLNFLAIEASEMNDAVAAYSDEYVVEDCKDGTIKVNRVGDPQEVYAFDASRQYPLQVGPGSADSYTALDLCWELEGTWTCDEGNFIDFFFGDGKPYMLFAVWESGGAFPTAEMTNLREIGENKFQLTLNFLAIEASEINDALAAYSDEYVVEDCRDGTIKVNRVGDPQKVYIYDVSRQS